MSGSYMKKFVIAGAAGLAALLGAASAQTVAIMNGEVHTVSGGVIENGDVIIQNGRIAQVGADLTAPDGATVIDATGKTVTPGLFAPFSNIGLVEIGLDEESNDSSPQGAFPLGAALDTVDAYNPFSTLIGWNRAGGVTRALMAPSAGGTIFGGKAAVIDMTGRPGSITKPQAAQVATLGYGGAARSGDTRMGSWAVVREYFDEARSYQTNPNDYVRRPHDGRFAVSDIKALVPVLEGQQPLVVQINSENDLHHLIELKNAYRIRVIVVGGSEAWRVGRELAAANIPVMVGAMDNLPSQFEDLSSTLQNAARLQAAGVKLSFYDGAHNVRLIRQHAGNAVAEGLDYSAALRAITLTPAEMFGLGGQLGSLDAGKVADVVIWDGDPLEVTTAPEAVFIAGVRQGLDSRQSALADRYHDLDRGDLPHAYRGGE